MSTLYNAWPGVIVAMREEKKLTQEDCGAKAGVSPKTWSRWEQPGFRPNDKQLTLIVKGLGCTTEEIGARYFRAMAAEHMNLAGPEEDGAAATGATVVGPGFDVTQMSEEERQLLMDELLAEQDAVRFDAMMADALRRDPEPETFTELLDNTIRKTFKVIVGATEVIADTVEHWPKLEAQATEEETSRLTLVRAKLTEMLSLSMRMIAELNDMSEERTGSEEDAGRKREAEESDETTEGTRDVPPSGNP